MKKNPNLKGVGWWRFRTRIPFIHTRFIPSQFVQGFVVTAATSLAVVPLLQGVFGLSFEEAVAVSFIHGLFMLASPVIFGEPYSPGMLTPALPLVIAFIASNFPMGPERFQAMAAMSLTFAAVLIVFSLTGSARKLIANLPNALKAGIILGAAFSALQRVFVTDIALFEKMPLSAGFALGVALIMTFSVGFQQLRQRHLSISRLAGFGLLPAFIIAALVGLITGELEFNIRHGWFIPPVMDVFYKMSPLSIGWPPLSMYLEALPLVLVTYVIFFGDYITGAKMNEAGKESRPEDIPDEDIDRTHWSVGLRNIFTSIIAPFYPYQGLLWTGVHAVVTARWRDTTHSRVSLSCAITSYYIAGVFVFFSWTILSLFQPLMTIALMLTLALTAVACLLAAAPMLRDPMEWVLAILIGFCFALLPALPAILSSVFLLFALGHPIHWKAVK